MSTETSISLQFNRHSWKVFRLGEEEILLTLTKPTNISVIHESAALIMDLLKQHLMDIVPAYQSITVFTTLSAKELMELLMGRDSTKMEAIKDVEQMTLPICYEVDSDMEMIADHVGLSHEEIIEIHLAGTYRSLFIGFTPGFVYADGLDPRLACPRKETPDTKVAGGSVGIGGTQTGIYAMESPGGWHILGRTPVQLFNPGKVPPMNLSMGTTFRFERISKEQFDSWGS